MRDSPGGDFSEDELGPVEGRIHAGTEVGPEDRESFGQELRAADRLDERLHLELGVEPAVLKAGPGAPGRGHALAVLGVVHREADRRPVDDRLLEPGVDALDRPVEVGLAVELHVP